MTRNPPRILARRHWSEAALWPGLEALKMLPRASELALVEQRLAESLRNEPREESISGIRVTPRARAELDLDPALHADRDLDEAVARASAVAVANEHNAEAPARRSAGVAGWVTAAIAIAASIAMWASSADRREPMAPATARSSRVELPGAAAFAAGASLPAPIPGSATTAASEPAAANTEVAPAGRRKSHSAARLASKPDRKRGASSSAPRVTGAPALERRGGVLNINSIPYSRVVLDGRPLGATPRVQVAVSAGAHTVVFIHPDHGRISKQVHVDPGGTALAAVRF